MARESALHALQRRRCPAISSAHPTAIGRIAPATLRAPATATSPSCARRAGGRAAENPAVRAATLRLNARAPRRCAAIAQAHRRATECAIESLPRLALGDRARARACSLAAHYSPLVHGIAQLPWRWTRAANRDGPRGRQWSLY